MNNKLIILPAVLGALLAGSVLGTSVVKAETESGFGARFPFVQDLAERLGLSEDEVTTAMGDVRNERRVERRERQEARLEEAVADGVVTEEQKQMLLEHREEMEAEREQRRAEMQEWREQSGIDFEVLREYGCRGGMGGGFGMREGHGFKGW